MTRSPIDTTQEPQTWRLCDVLAQGHSNNVVLVENDATSERVVAKILPKNFEESFLEAFEREASIHEELHHSRIIKFKGFLKNLKVVDSQGYKGQFIAIQTELASNGDLFDLLATFEQLPLLIARSYARQMVEAVAYLHSKGIAHRDLKLENFLLDEKFNLKLTDFGFSCKTTETEMLTDVVGTYSYLSPEQHKNAVYNGFEVDIFNLGVAIFMLVAGKMPFEKATEDDQLYKHFVNGEEDKFWEMHEELYDASSSQPHFRIEFKQLINSMLSFDSASRININEVMRHPWLTVASAAADKCGEIVAECLKKKNLL